MSVSWQALRCFSPFSSSSSSTPLQWRSPPLIRCSRSASLQEAAPFPSPIELRSPPPPPPPPEDNSPSTSTGSSSSGIQVPRQRYIAASKSELLDAILSSMFPSPEETSQFLALCRCLDSILHAEHKAILEEMRGYYDELAVSNKAVKADELSSEDDGEDEEDENHSNRELSLPFGFKLSFDSLWDFSSRNAQSRRDSIKASR